MTTETLARLVALEMWGFGIGLMGAVLYQMVTGGINLEGLLRSKSRATGDAGRISPPRVQLLMLSMAAAFGYVALLPDAAPGSLPEVPTELLLLFGGSASIYLGGKGTPLLKAELLRSEPDTPTDRESEE